MKICLINNIYPPFHRGGAEQVVVKTAEGLVENGHEVVIITSSPNGSYVERKPELTIYRIHPRNFYFYTKGHEHNFFVRFLWHTVDIFNFSLSKKIENILLEEEPNVVHTHNLMGLSFLIPRMIRKRKFKHVHTVHDVQLIEPSGLILKSQEKNWRYNGFPTKTYTWLMKKMMGSPQVVISPSQFLLDFYKKRGFFVKSNFVVLRNPATFNLNVDCGVKNEEYSEFNFLYLGQIEYHKGVELLVEVFGKLDQNSKCKLHIVGGGSKLEEIRKKALDNPLIKIYGHMKREELPELFSKMNMTVVPSLCYENSPTVIFESLHFNIPVLASNIEGIAELIQEWENGLTFRAGDAQDLERKIKWCLDYKDKVEEMGIKAKETLKSLSGEKYIERLEELYQD